MKPVQGAVARCTGGNQQIVEFVIRPRTSHGTLVVRLVPLPCGRKAA